MDIWQVATASPEETRSLGRLLGEELEPPCVILLAGDLGAGKTCFTQGLARGMGVGEEQPVTSPSYTLMNHYEGRAALYHFDLYRLAHPDELLEIGFDEFVHGTGVAVVEWVNRMEELDLEGLRIVLTHEGEERRSIRFEAAAEPYRSLLERVRQRWNQEGEG